MIFQLLLIVVITNGLDGQQRAASASVAHPRTDPVFTPYKPPASKIPAVNTTDDAPLETAENDSAQAKVTGSLCTAALKSLPWEAFQTICAAREKVAHALQSVNSVPSELAFREYVDKNAQITGDLATKKAYEMWNKAHAYLLSQNTLGECIDGGLSMEEEATFRLAPTFVSLQYEVEKQRLRIPTRSESQRWNLNQSASGTQAHLKAAMAQDNFFKIMVATGGDKLINSVLLALQPLREPRQLAKTDASPPVPPMDTKTAVATLLATPKVIPARAEWTPTKVFDAVRATRKHGVLLETNTWTKLNGRLFSRSRTFVTKPDAVKCQAACRDAVSRFAPAPGLLHSLKAAAAHADNKLQALMAPGDRVNLAQVLFEDVRAANLVGNKLVSDAIMTFVHTKRVIRVFATRLVAFLRWSLANLAPHNAPWTVGNADTFWAFFLGHDVTGTGGAAHGQMTHAHPDLASNSAYEQAYVGEVGSTVRTEAQLNEAIAEGNVRQTLSLLYRLMKADKLSRLIELALLWGLGNEGHHQLNALLNAHGAIRLDAAYVRSQRNRPVDGQNTQDFCFNEWVTAPFPGMGGFLKYGCGWNIFYQGPGDNLKRWRWLRMDEVVPPLTDKEMLFLFHAEATEAQGCNQCRNIDYLRKGHRRVPWRCGGDVGLANAPEAPMPKTGGNAQGFQEWSAAAAQTARGGPSGTTDVFMHFAKYFSIAGDDLIVFRNALAAWMELGGDHSLHEVLAAAEPFGLPYARYFSAAGVGWQHVMSELFLTITEVAVGNFVPADPSGHQAAFFAHLNAMYATQAGGLAMQAFNCLPSDYMDTGSLHRRATQWWWMNSYADEPAGAPPRRFCMKPTPRRDIPTVFLPAADAPTSERLGYTKITAWDDQLNQGVSILLAFDPANGNAVGRVQFGVHATWAAYQGACNGLAHQRSCVQMPTATAAELTFELAMYYEIDLAHLGTNPDILHGHSPNGPLYAVSIRVGASQHRIVSHSLVDITFLSKALATMKHSQPQHRSCRVANNVILIAFAASVDQRSGFYAPNRFNVQTISSQMNIVHWGTAREHLCSNLIANVLGAFVQATARCGLAAADVSTRTPESVLESCTEGALRFHSMGCHFTADAPVTCDLSVHWWRELAHRVVVCLYTHDEHYPQFRRFQPNQALWRNNAIDILNDMVRHPFSEAYFPPYKDSLVFSGVKGKSEQWLRETVANGHTVALDWRSFTRDPLVAWKFANTRKFGNPAAANPEPVDGPTTMLVLINAPPATDALGSPRARMIFQSYRIFDNQAEVLMPPMRVTLVAKRTYYCPDDIPVHVHRSDYDRPVGPYTEVYIQFHQYIDYDGTAPLALPN